MPRARLTQYVILPHLIEYVLNTDEAIISAYARLPRRISRNIALRQARSRGVTYIWTVWDGDQPTGNRYTSEHWCEEAIKRLNAEAKTADQAA